MSAFVTPRDARGTWLTAADMPVHDGAVIYAQLGLHVVLLHGAKRIGRGWRCSCSLAASCPMPGAHPRSSSWRTWISAADAVRRWFEMYSPSNVGLRVGIGDHPLVVLDVEPEAKPQLAQLGVLPPTLVAFGPDGIKRYFFTAPGTVPPDRAIVRVSPDGIRAVADEFVVAPPSIVVGGRWAWDTNQPMTIAEAPRWLLDLAATAPLYEPVTTSSKKRRRRKQHDKITILRERTSNAVQTANIGDFDDHYLDELEVDEVGDADTAIALLDAMFAESGADDPEPHPPAGQSEGERQ